MLVSTFMIRIDFSIMFTFSKANNMRAMVVCQKGTNALGPMDLAEEIRRVIYTFGQDQHKMIFEETMQWHEIHRKS
jgi:hypothetical protein